MALPQLPLVAPTDPKVGWRLTVERVNALIRGPTPIALPYSASIKVDASLTDWFLITVTNATGFTITAPLNYTNGQRLTFTIRNTSGGAMGTITWDAIFKLAAFTNPANGHSRSIEYRVSGGLLIEVNRTPGDVPN